MDKAIKTITIISVLAIVATICFVSSLPKDKLTLEEEMEICKSIQASNNKLPRQIGTIGTLDAMRFHNRTLCYEMTLLGDSEIIEFYRSHYDDFRSVALYSLTTLNGQNGNADKLAEYCNKKKINIGITITFANNETISWNFAPNELYDFLHFFNGTPTDAMKTVLDFHIEAANYLCSNVTINSMESLSDDGMAFVSIERNDNDIIFMWSVDEQHCSINDLSASFQVPHAANVILGEFVADPDVQELVNLISISHSNILLRYKGHSSKKEVDLYIPYDILKQYSQVPFIH